MATYDPVSTAKALADSYIYARQTQVNTGTSKAQGKVTALSSLQSALSTFTTALGTLSGKGSVVAQTATVSRSTAATASASSSASAGTYSFSVSQLATAQQSLYSMQELGLALDTSYPQDTTLVVTTLGGSGYIQLDLSAADENHDGKLSVTEIARALNKASEGKITAAVVTENGEQKLLLNATSTGLENAFQLHKVSTSTAAADAAQLAADWANTVAALKTQDQAGTAVTMPPAGGSGIGGTQLALAQNAVLSLGGGSGAEIRQASNTYTGIEGLSLVLQEASSSPFTVTVAKDDSATKSNMQGFVDAYNTLVKAIDKLTAAGNADTKVSAGPLNGDSGVRGLRNQLNSLLRTSVGGVSLTDYGISAQRDGTIALDADRFAKKVAANPDGLNTLLGQTNTLEYKRSGVMGTLQTYINTWTNSTTGYLKNRQDGLQKQLAQYTKDQSTIDRLHDQAYQRYLTQFTALANLEATMGNTTGLLGSLFSSSSK
ncbi:flagellar filament capping protein FliD [Comamonas guangdongensis]|uniref:Flagellar hook-associated protein 2 n=1 Tax=Comamonas guangdongensis TaxID=510515 RepID=A0ABV3ZS80_9BURK